MNISAWHYHKEDRVTALENCRWTPRWVSHMGCILGCLEYLDIPILEPWLYGGTGHAFVINVHQDVCLSGPTAWNTVKLCELGANLGYAVTAVVARKDQPGFRSKQRAAWDHARRAIDRGYPCYGFELEVPEYSVIWGYDEDGYYHSGPGSQQSPGPIPWEKPGTSDIGLLEVYSVEPGIQADPATVVDQAVRFALAHAAGDQGWTSSPCATGISAFERWIDALRNQTASSRGMRYNAAVWLECRRNAVGFLEEVRSRIPERTIPAIDEAIQHYGAVAANLGVVAQIYPWLREDDLRTTIPNNEKSRAGIEALEKAKTAEAAGLRALTQLITTF